MPSVVWRSSSTRRWDVAAAVDLPAGTHQLDGATALGFVRARSIDDDLGRIGRQQYFLQQLAREAASPTTVLNPLRLVSTTGAVGDSLIADEGFGPIDMLRLGSGGTRSCGRRPADLHRARDACDGRRRGRARARGG
jgi:hypothetical protein